MRAEQREVTAAAGVPVASVVVLCCNHVEVTRVCLESLRASTAVPYELIVVDNGSSDGTMEYLNVFAREGRGPVQMVLIRNEANRGFAAGVNQGLQHARGEHVVLLNNDTVLSPGWLEGLLAVLGREDCQPVGMVGPVSNEVPAPQRVEPSYGRDLRGLSEFAAARQAACRGAVLEVERLSGFCVLIPRRVLERVGLLDEQFGLGFFEDDDLGVRVRRAGFRMWVALDTFVHHWGSTTVRSLGLDAGQLLRENHSRFRRKWGDELASRYRAPEPIGTSKGQPDVIVPAEDGPVTVSLCMIVRNEEGNLAACLSSVKDLVQEIVVVDTGSTDRTVEIAREHGASVIETTWPDSFAAARNISVEHATGDYVFWMDADDRLDEANRAALKEIFASLRRGEMVGYSMKCVCLPDPASGATTVVDHVRLFPRHPTVRWRYRVHEQILPALRRAGGAVRFTGVQIHHVGYQDPALRARKLERDIRLLALENQEHPDDPFTLFNLGSVLLELGRPSEALPPLVRSLARSHVSDSIVRKLYALISSAHKAQGQSQQALQVCRDGRRHYPDDAELLFREAVLRREAGDLSGSATCLERLLTAKESEHFASLDPALRGYRARAVLADVYVEQARTDDAEALWTTALREEGENFPNLSGLGEAYLAQERWEKIEEIAQRLDCLNPGQPAGGVLRSRSLLRQKRFPEVKLLLDRLEQDHPRRLELLVLRSHAYLQEGKDWEKAEQALQAILAVAPEHAEARSNLAVLHRQLSTAALSESI
jgi:GT2 family glycosyltransferase/tetratricopeptide (TPR) repeat protein